jgi:hypothetical protein
LLDGKRGPRDQNWLPSFLNIVFDAIIIIVSRFYWRELICKMTFRIKSAL